MAGEDNWAFSVQPEVYFLCQIFPESAGEKLIDSGGWMNAGATSRKLSALLYLYFLFL